MTHRFRVMTSLYGILYCTCSTRNSGFSCKQFQIQISRLLSCSHHHPSLCDLRRVLYRYRYETLSTCVYSTKYLVPTAMMAASVHQSLEAARHQSLHRTLLVAEDLKGNGLVHRNCMSCPCWSVLGMHESSAKKRIHRQQHKG